MKAMPFPESRVNAVIDSMQWLPDRIACRFSLHTGIRLTEVISLTEGDIVNADGSVRDVIDLPTIKMDRPHCVVVTARLKEYVEELRTFYGGFNRLDHAAFRPECVQRKTFRKAMPKMRQKTLTRMRNGKEVRYKHKYRWGAPFCISPARMKKLFKAAVRSQGLDSGYSFHSLRKTFAARCRAAGADLYELMQLLGHSSPTTTVRYLEGIPAAETRAILERASL
jgi:integrase